MSAVLLIVAAVACFAALDTSTKQATTLAPVAMAVWMRYLVQALATGASLLPQMRGDLLRTRRPLLQALRGALLLLCSVIAFYSLKAVQVGEFTAVVMLCPLLLTVLAAWALRERVSWLRWLCVGAGFAGSLLVLRPGSELFSWAMLLPLLLVLANTGFQLLTSHLSKTEDPRTTHLYTGVVGLGLASLALPWAWQALPESTWLVLAMMGGFSTLGHYLLILAFGRAPVAVLTPYLYMQIAFATLFAWVMFKHLPDAWSFAGLALVAAGGVLGTWLTARETRSSAAQQQGLVDA